jgi:hypothetical protein
MEYDVNGWEIERCFTPYFAFKPKFIKKEIPAFDEGLTIQSNLFLGNKIYINAVEDRVNAWGNTHSKKERRSQAYDELVNHLVWNGLSVERFWLYIVRG